MIAFYITGIYPCSIGGMEIFYYHLTNALSKSENVILITNCRKTKPNPKIKVIHISSKLFLMRRYGFGKFSLFLTSVFQLYRYRKEIDVIHITAASITGFYGAIFPLVKYITGIPYVVSFHGGGLYPWSKHSFYPRLYKNTSKAIAVSSVIKEILEKRTRTEFEIIYPLIPFSKTFKSKKDLRIQYGIAENARILLMAGSLKPIKGSRFVVESFLNLEKEYLEKNQLILLLAGDGEDKNSIVNSARQNGLSDFVKLTGNIPNETIHELFALSDIYIIASEFEGTSKSLLEAMCCGMPIIASNVNGINNIIKDGKNGLLFDYNNEKSFILKLKEMLENKKLSCDLGEQAKITHDTNYSFDKTVSAYKVVFQKVRNGEQA
jgi:glycosyltransferase involved in cell wall biosynthesis